MINEAERKGLEKGHAEGMAEGLSKAALGFYKNKVPIEIIANSLNMTEEQVQEIISKSPTQKA